MKMIKIYLPFLAALATLLLNLSCTRETPQVAPLDNTLGTKAAVQVFSATVKATRNYVYVDNLPVSGAAVAFAGVFPGTAYAFTTASGNRSFLIKDTLATSTQVPLTFSQTLDAGKSYTIFTYDTITSVKQTTVLNTITVPKDTSCMLRFANFIYNTTAVPAIDVYSYRRGATTPVFSNVATASATAFIPYASGLTDTLYLYNTGTTTPLLAKFFITSMTPTRSYTAAYCGSYKAATKSLSLFATY